MKWTSEPAPSCVFTVPIRLGTGLNAREHWRVRAARVKAERSAVWFAAATKRRGRWPPGHPCIVRLTRIGPRKLDSDNLQGSAKAVRDQVAELLGVDDGDEAAVTWEYAQERGPYAVRVEIRGRT